jgi:large subunit ribosomal protein L3
MGSLHRPRHGSLQFWPRKRAEKQVPSVNWKRIEEQSTGKTLLGTIAYKAGMCSVIAKDNTMHSLTKGKTIVIPATILECPPVKIFGIRFYKAGKVAFDILSPNLDKELKRKIKFPKKEISQDINPENFENVHVLAYADVKKTGIKKTPDIAEIAIKGKNSKEKFEAAKNLLGKEISISDVLDKNQLVDIHSVTKAKGLSGPVKRFGITFKQHKSEKGQRRPGSLGPWHPHRVTYMVPMQGQLGYFSRVQYNSKVLDIDNIAKSKLDGKVFMNYGKIDTKYCALKGSIAGPQKRAIMLTFSVRPTKSAEKENFEIVRYS